MSIFPMNGARGLQRSVLLKSYNVQKLEIRLTLGLSAAKNMHFMKKSFNKSSSKSNFAQKSPRAHLSTSATSGAKGLLRSVCLKSYASYTQASYSESNFAQKSPWTHLSTSPTNGARGLQRSVCLKSYNVQKWEIRFTLVLNAAKNTHFLKKSFK